MKALQGSWSWVWAALAAVAVAGSCGGEQAGGGGSGGSGGGGSSSSSTGSSSSSSSSSGQGAGGAGGAGQVPQWEPATSIVGCTVEHLANAPEVRFLSWEKCGFSTECEQAVFHEPWLVGDTEHLSRSYARTTELGPVVTASLSGPSGETALFARADGWLLDGYRVRWDNGCFLLQVTTGTEHYGFAIGRGKLPTNQLGAMVRPLDQSVPPAWFEVVPTPTGIGPQIYVAMDPGRWVWQFYPDKLASVSVLDGSGYTEFVKSQSGGPVLAVNFPASTPTGFIFELVETPDQVKVVGRIAWTDGLLPPADYLTPPDGVYYGRPGYAGSHVGFFRGTAQKDVNLFETVEVWAAAYSDNPAQLAPYKVADFPAVSMPTIIAAGYGRLATYSGANDYREIVMWSLGGNGTNVWQLPDTEQLYDLPGITADWLWVLARKADMTDPKVNLLLRYPLQ